MGHILIFELMSDVIKVKKAKGTIEYTPKTQIQQLLKHKYSKGTKFGTHF